jgi:transposase
MAGHFEEADEIDVVERSFRVVRHKRQKYRCRCGAGIETALGPDKLVAGGRYSIDFAVDVAIAKYADHMPLERQVRQMARDGLDVDFSTLWEQTWFLSQHLLPTYEANHAHVLSSDVIAVDETWWRLMKKGASKRWWVWSVAREDAVSYRLLPSRSTEAARTVLDDYTGVAICDGYKAYDTLARERAGSDLILAHCWAHVRRKFVEAEPHYPEAGEMIDLIGQLYAIEAEAKRASPEERLATLAALRAKQSKSVLDEIRTWLMTQRALPRSALGKAIAYTGGLWPGLVRFLDDPKIPLDTNGVERASSVRGGQRNQAGNLARRCQVFGQGYGEPAAGTRTQPSSSVPCGCEGFISLGSSTESPPSNPAKTLFETPTLWPLTFRAGARFPQGGAGLLWNAISDSWERLFPQAPLLLAGSGASPAESS